VRPDGSDHDVEPDVHPDGPHHAAGDGQDEANRQVPKQFKSRRGHADNMVILDGGSIAWHQTTLRFEARCDKHGDRCRLTRSSEPSKRAGAIFQGRPLGLLGAWLAAGHHCNSKDEHVAFHSLDERQAAREIIKLNINGHAMLAREREKRDGEDSEPDDMP
jgi:hypothetical protein